MPNRIIRESLLTSRTLDRLSDGAERLFFRITVIADDYGRFDADAAVLLARCFPLKVGSWKPQRIAALRNELVQVGAIELYRIGETTYGCLPGWVEHQRTRASKPKFPAPDDPRASRGELPPVAETRAKLPPIRIRETRDERREAGDSPPAAAESAPVSGNGSHPEKTEKLRPEDIAVAWNEHCAPLGLAKVRELTGSRRDKVVSRLREHPEQQFWEEVFGAIPGQKFLLGKNDRKWRIDFDFLFDNDLNAVKVAEGKYGGT